jgi:hypothetical protein
MHSCSVSGSAAKTEGYGSVPTTLPVSLSFSRICENVSSVVLSWGINALRKHCALCQMHHFLTIVNPYLLSLDSCILRQENQM